LAGDVSELADHLDIDRFAVLGWSTGGPYAAAVAHGLAKRLTAAAIVAGEAPYMSDDFPQNVLNSDTFAGSGINKFFIWSANNCPWLIRMSFTIQRILLFLDPVGVVENAGSFFGLAKDKQFFTRDKCSTEQVEALRQVVEINREYKSEYK
jgi:pimeloyl-ACP methyl ester carboxylesterase